jgi:hypothetical protein
MRINIGIILKCLTKAVHSKNNDNVIVVAVTECDIEINFTDDGLHDCHKGQQEIKINIIPVCNYWDEMDVYVG